MSFVAARVEPLSIAFCRQDQLQQKDSLDWIDSSTTSGRFTTMTALLVGRQSRGHFTAFTTTCALGMSRETQGRVLGGILAASILIQPIEMRVMLNVSSTRRRRPRPTCTAPAVDPDPPVRRVAAGELFRCWKDRVAAASLAGGRKLFAWLRALALVAPPPENDHVPPPVCAEDLKRYFCEKGGVVDGRDRGGRALALMAPRWTRYLGLGSVRAPVRKGVGSRRPSAQLPQRRRSGRLDLGSLALPEPLCEALAALYGPLAALWTNDAIFARASRPRWPLRAARQICATPSVALAVGPGSGDVRARPRRSLLLKCSILARPAPGALQSSA